MQQLQLSDHDQQGVLQNIFLEINENILEGDEEIIEELQVIMKLLGEDDQQKVLQYLNQAYSGRSFLQKCGFKVGEIKGKKKDDQKQLYQVLQEKKQYETILKMMQSDEFCYYNNIPKIVQQNIAILSKLGDQIQNILELIAYKQCYENEISQFNLFKKLLFFIYSPPLADAEQQILESIIGSLLVNQIYQLQISLDQLKEKDEQGYQKLASNIQRKQLHSRKESTGYQEFQLSQQLAFFETFFTYDIRKSKENLDRYLREMLLLTDKQLYYDKIISTIEQMVLKEINLSNCYFMILLYFWIQYCNYYKLNDELTQLEINRDKVSEDRRFNVYCRFLAKQKKTTDQILIFLVHRSIYFTEKAEEALSQILNYQQYRKYELNLIDEFCIYKQLSILELINLEKEQFYHFWEIVQQLQHKDIINEVQEQKIRLMIVILWTKQIDDITLSILKIIFNEYQGTALECAMLIESKYTQESKQFIVNLIILASLFNNFETHELYFRISQFVSLKDGEAILKFQSLDLIKFITNLTSTQWKQITILFDQEFLDNLATNLLEYYLNNLQRDGIIFFKLFAKLFGMQNSNRNLKFECFKILCSNIDPKLLHLILLLNKQGKPKLQAINLTLYTLYALLNRLHNDVKFKVFQNLNLFIQQEYYNFENILSYNTQNIELKLIHKMMQAQYFYFTKQQLQLKTVCQQIYFSNEDIYQQWIQKHNYFKMFSLTPDMLKRELISNKYPNNLSIKLENFNILLAELSEEEQEKIIKNWCHNMNDKKYFQQLIPFFFNIIKREEGPNQLLSLIHSLKPRECEESYNMKALFQILYHNSNEELKVMLLKFRSKLHPIPMIYQNLDFLKISSEQNLFSFNEYLFYVYTPSYTIINFSLSKKRAQIGKTQLINEIFYQMRIFETCDTCDINQNTVDIMFDNSFNGSRVFTVADVHGQLPLSMITKILSFFKFWIIQMDSEEDLEQYFEEIKQLRQINSETNPKICLIIRNSTELFIEKYSGVIKKIYESDIQMHFIQDLTKRGLDYQVQQNEVDQASKFIFTQIKTVYTPENFVNQSNFLKVLRKFNSNQQIYKKIEEDGQIIYNLEKELNLLIDKPDGFFNQEAFPIRSIEAKIKHKRDLLCRARQKGDSESEIITQLQQDIEDLEKLVNKQKLTKILSFFCSIFNQKNYYILYLSFTDSIRKFNEEKTKQLQKENQLINEKIQRLKIEKNQLRNNNNQQILQYDRLQQIQEEMNRLKEKLDEAEKNLSFRNIAIEIFWRELISLQQLCSFEEFQINPVDKIYDMMKKGEPFEFFDGDQLKINSQFLSSLVDKFEKKGEEKVLVFSVLGPQGSGKSTLLNKIFGCHFQTSVCRSTKGIYLQLLKIHNKEYFNNQFEYILLLDTEGLQNPNQQDQEFDKKIALFVLAISDIILINVKGEINQQFKNLVEICIYTLGRMKRNFLSIQQLRWCFNQNNDGTKFALFLTQIQGIVSNLNAEYADTGLEDQIDYNDIVDIKEENIQNLGFSSLEKVWKINRTQGIFQEWRQLINNDAFSQEAYCNGIKMIIGIVTKIATSDEQITLLNLNLFIQNVSANWESIQRLADLLEFSELIQHQQNKLMKAKFEEIYMKQNFSFTDNIKYDISKEVEKYQGLSFDIFNQISQQKEREICHKFDQIKQSMSEDLQLIKSQYKISKKITTKHLFHLDNIINSQKNECRLRILDEIQNYERQYQELNQFVAELSLKEVELQWNKEQPYQIKLNQFQTIIQSFTQYISKTQRQSKFISYLISINHLSPDQNPNEKQELMQIFYQEFEQKQQFMTIDKSQKNIRFRDIFYQPMNQKIKISNEANLVNISKLYYLSAHWWFIEQSDLVKYMSGNQFFRDLMDIVENQKKNKNFFEKILNFFTILQYFSISYNQEAYQHLLDTIQNPKFWTLKLPDQQVEESFSKFTQTLQYSMNIIVIKDTYFIQHFLQFYPSLIPKSRTQEFKQFQEFYEERDKILQYSIILQEQVLPKPKQQSKFFEYILNPAFFEYQNSIIPSVPDLFNNEMIKNQGWQKLYYSIYDIIKDEMIDNRSEGSNVISQNKQQLDSSDIQGEDDTCAFNNSLIKIIMTKIQLQIIEFNKQFANYGVIFRDIGEECIYYFSLLVIWRFGRYKKQKA